MVSGGPGCGRPPREPARESRGMGRRWRTESPCADGCDRTDRAWSAPAAYPGSFLLALRMSAPLPVSRGGAQLLCTACSFGRSESRLGAQVAVRAGVHAFGPRTRGVSESPPSTSSRSSSAVAPATAPRERPARSSGRSPSRATRRVSGERTRPGCSRTLRARWLLRHGRVLSRGSTANRSPSCIPARTPPSPWIPPARSLYCPGWAMANVGSAWEAGGKIGNVRSPVLAGGRRRRPKSGGVTAHPGLDLRWR